MNRFFYFILFYWIATSPLAALQLQNLKVEYLGDRTFSTTLTSADRQAASLITSLSQVLAALTHIQEQTEEANQKIRFIQENMKRRKTKE